MIDIAHWKLHLNRCFVYSSIEIVYIFSSICIRFHEYFRFNFWRVSFIYIFVSFPLLLGFRLAHFYCQFICLFEMLFSKVRIICSKLRDEPWRTLRKNPSFFFVSRSKIFEYMNDWEWKHDFHSLRMWKKCHASAFEYVFIIKIVILAILFIFLFTKYFERFKNHLNKKYNSLSTKNWVPKFSAIHMCIVNAAFSLCSRAKNFLVILNMKK